MRNSHIAWRAYRDARSLMSVTILPSSSHASPSCEAAETQVDAASTMQPHPSKQHTPLRPIFLSSSRVLPSLHALRLPQGTALTETHSKKGAYSQTHEASFSVTCMCVSNRHSWTDSPLATPARRAKQQPALPGGSDRTLPDAQDRGWPTKAGTVEPDAAPKDLARGVVDAADTSTPIPNTNKTNQQDAPIPSPPQPGMHQARMVMTH